MEILESALGSEIEQITQSTTPFERQYWTAEIHNPNETVNTFKVISIDRIRDYESNFTDEIIVKVLIPLGQYTYRVYPFLDNIELTLYRYAPSSNVADMLQGSNSISHERFAATVIKPPAASVEMNNRNQPSEGVLDLIDFIELDIQLVNKAVDQMRMRTVGGIYRTCTAADIVKFVLTSESQKINVSSENIPLGVDMVPVLNPIKRDHIVIPQGTRLVDAPSFIHKHCGGIYPTGLSYYFQTGIWYVFPTYNTQRFDTTLKTLTLINIPALKMPGIEKTYMVKGNHLTVLATGETKVLNTSEQLLLNHGNGVRFANASSFMETFAETVDNKAVVSRGRTNNEFITIKRDNGVNNVLSSQTRITANPLLEYSKLAARDGAVLMMSWENSDPDLIYPGMPVRMKYLDGDIIKEVDGVVLKLHHYTQLGPDGTFTNRHLSTTNIAIFVKRAVFKNA